MTRPIAGPLNKTGIDESTDAYDTIDWLVKNVPESNGRVGTIGSSYLGFTTLMSEINPHPALKAAVPESPMVDTWIGDDDFHNGAFRVPSFDYFLEMSTGKADAGAKIARGEGDDYTVYLEAGSAGDFARKWGIDQVPSVRKVMDNPAYTDFWRLQAVDKWFAARPLTVPTMLEVGQWDQEDSYGAPAVYRALKDKYEGTDLLHLVIGPWRHSGANHYGYELGDLTFTGDTALQWRTQYLKPLLDQHLKGAPDPHTPPVLTYATGVNAGRRARAGRWARRRRSIWRQRHRPGFDRPAAAGQRRICLRPGANPCRSCRGRSTWRTSTNGIAWLVARSALRRRTSRRDQLHQRAADQAGAHHGTAAGRPVRRDQRDRQRLGGQADRRLSQRHSRRRVAGREARHGRLRAADRNRDLPRPLCPRQGACRARCTPGKVERISLGACPTSITCSCRATGSWCRSSRACSRSTIATRRPSFRTSSTPRRAIIAQRDAEHLHGGATASAVLLPVVP